MTLQLGDNIMNTTDTAGLLEAAIVILTKIEGRTDVISGKMLKDNIRTTVEALSDEVLHQARKRTKEQLNQTIADAKGQ